MKRMGYQPSPQKKMDVQSPSMNDFLMVCICGMWDIHISGTFGSCLMEKHTAGLDGSAIGLTVAAK
jgi:hypothetical protein